MAQMRGVKSVDPRWRSIHEDGSDFPGETHPSMIALNEGKSVQNVIMGVFNPVDAKYRWINVNAKPLFREGEPKPYQVFSTFQDITARKSIEDELEVSEDRYRSIINDMMDVIIRWNADGEITFINHAFSRYFSIGQKDVLGLKLSEVLDGGLKPVYDMVVKSMSYTNPITEQDIDITLFDEMKRCKHVRSRGIFTQKGQLKEVQSVARDITLIKNMVEALEETKSRWETTFNAMEDWIALVDSDSIILQSNSAGMEITGMKESELLGKLCCKVVHDTDSPIDECPMKQMLISGKRESVELEVNGMWLSITVDPVKDLNGNITSAVHIIRDISDKKRAEEERERLIEQLQKALEEVKTLSGLLPICSFCKKIRDDKGYWNQIEEYIGDHSDAKFSHSFCPECAKREYGDYMDDDEDEKG